MHSRNDREISGRSIGVIRAGGFRNNVPIAIDRFIRFTKKVGTAKHLVIMRKEFESRHFSDPSIDYIDEISIPEPKRQNDDKAAKEEESNQQKKQDLHPRSQRSKSKIAFLIVKEKILELRSGPGFSFGVSICLVTVRLFDFLVFTVINTLHLGKKYSTLFEKYRDISIAYKS